MGKTQCHTAFGNVAILRYSPCSIMVEGLTQGVKQSGSNYPHLSHGEPAFKREEELLIPTDTGTGFVNKIQNLLFMMTQAAVFYKGALAHYRVRKEADGSFTAQLLYYKGQSSHAPPKEMSFVKEGRHCTGTTGEQELLDDLYETVKTYFGGLLNRANGYHL